MARAHQTSTMYEVRQMSRRRRELITPTAPPLGACHVPQAIATAMPMAVPAADAQIVQGMPMGGAGAGIAEQLVSLSALHAAGQLDAQQFEAAKANLLGTGMAAPGGYGAPIGSQYVTTTTTTTTMGAPVAQGALVGPYAV